MQLERYEPSFEKGRIVYRLHSDYDGGSIAVEPKELMALLTLLQEHENEIIQDALSNSVNDEMKGL